MKIDVAEVYAMSGRDNTDRFDVVSYALTIYRVGVVRYAAARLLHRFEKEPQLGRDIFGARVILLGITIDPEDAQRLYPQFTRQFNKHWVLSRLDRRIQKG